MDKVIAQLSYDMLKVQKHVTNYIAHHVSIEL